jgi:hypothetical protein
MNRYVNPYFGYRFIVEADATNTTFKVAFTNGVKTLYLQPNATQTTLPDYSTITIDKEGFSYYSPSNYGYDYYYYDPTTPEDYVYGSNSSEYDNYTYWDYYDNEEKTKYTQDGCQVTKKTFKDLSHGTSYSFVCSNGTYIFYPSAWYNYTYSYWDYQCDDYYYPLADNSTNSTSNSTSISNATSKNYYNYYDSGCYRTYSYFYNESTLSYEYYQNQSYKISFTDGTFNLFNYRDIFGTGDKAYYRDWMGNGTNADC